MPRDVATARGRRLDGGSSRLDLAARLKASRMAITATVPEPWPHRALALHQIAELTSAWGNIAAKITDQSAHPATSRVPDPLQCLVLSLGEGDATALQSKQQTD